MFRELVLGAALSLTALESHAELPFGPEAFCRERRPQTQSQSECETAQREAAETVLRSYTWMEEGSPEGRMLNACVVGASVGNLTDQVALLRCLRARFGSR